MDEAGPRDERGRPATAAFCRRGFTLSIVAATLVLLASAWVSSGTMAPYAATLDPGVVWSQPPCDYLINIDQPHFEAAFAMRHGKVASCCAGYSIPSWRCL